MTAPRLRLGQLLRLALCDLWHERWLALCAACVIAAALAPLWTLRGLAHGAVDAVLTRLEADPRKRLVQSEGATAHPLDAAWFERVASWPEVAVVIPKTRDLAGAVTLYAPHAARPLPVWLLATAAGDPSLGTAAAPAGMGLSLSSEAARQLNVSVGDRVQVLLERRYDEVESRHAPSLTVASIIPAETAGNTAAFGSLALMNAIMDWLDPDRRPELAGAWHEPDESGAGAPPDYRRFRAFARTIRDAEALALRFQSEGIAVVWSADEVGSALALQRNLRAIFALIAVIATTGAVLAVGALQLANHSRKRRDYALLKLTGHGRGWLISMPAVQAACIALAGVGIAAAIFRAAATLINRFHADALVESGLAVTLPPGDFGIGAAAAAIVAIAPAIAAGWRAAMLEAADELREL